MTTPEIDEKPFRSFRKNELKPLLVRQMKQERPDFRFLTFATSVYYFQRIRDFRDYNLKEMLHIVYSFTDHTMQASLSSRLNPVHTLNPIYNNGFINPHVDLATLKSGSNVSPGEMTYRCDGTTDSTHEMVRMVIDDFKEIGMRYFDRRLKRLHDSHVINTGLDIIEQWDFDKTMLGNELQGQLRKAKFSVSKVRHPLLNRLKAQLESVAHVWEEDSRDICLLAFDLMELYCNRRIAAY